MSAATTGNSKRIHLLLHLVAGAGILLFVGWLAAFSEAPFWASRSRTLAVVLGLGTIAAGFLRHTWSAAVISRRLCIFLLAMFAAVAVLELFFRVIGFDFAREEQAWHKTPIYFRQPVIPTGDVFFRRPGPEEWTGQVLNARLQQLKVTPNPYRDEPIITVRYDRLGFRNESGETNWEIVVAGDSFTELGYLPHEQLFTELLAKRLGVRVRNLGVSFTGPLTQLSHLRDFGVVPATHRAVIVFFEGNDLKDLNDEYAALVKFRHEGKRPTREFRKRTSVVQHTYNLAKSFLDGRRTSWITGYFKSSHGRVPVTLGFAPPNENQLPPATRQHLDEVCKEFATFGKERSLEVTLVFMPCKERVIHGMVDFSPDAPAVFKQWRPTDLPSMMGRLAARHGIRYLDLTPALVNETKVSGELLYNSILDSHLNARGSFVVAEELARHLALTNRAPERQQRK
jgi:hypothetical protein